MQYLPKFLDIALDLKIALDSYFIARYPAANTLFPVLFFLFFTFTSWSELSQMTKIPPQNSVVDKGLSQLVTLKKVRLCAPL